MCGSQRTEKEKKEEKGKKKTPKKPKRSIACGKEKRKKKKTRENVTILESAERSSLLQREKQKLARQVSGEIKTFILSSRVNERDTFVDGIHSCPRRAYSNKRVANIS